MQVLCTVGCCQAVLIPATSRRHPLADHYLTEMQCSFETHDAQFLGYNQSFQFTHFTSNYASVLSFIVHVIAYPFFFSNSGCLAFWLRNAQRLLFFSLSRILFFLPVTNTTFAHIILSSRCTVSNVFCFFNYPKLFFRHEPTITRSCSHRLLNT